MFVGSCRVAAGQKSISADDLVVFAEMFYLVSGATSPPMRLILRRVSTAHPRFLGNKASPGWPKTHRSMAPLAMPSPAKT